uniref:Uncharacterized protein n=1 Tax=Vitis vinifera TaxID=29760 RepID=A5B691_VITVI|nr:hypothetical protein VITISV_026993 [Vitis vinifera]
MGKGIVRRTSPEEPGKRSRLVMQEDICHVLENLTGTKRVEVIDLDLSGLKEVRFTTAAFAKMTKLRLLRITAPQMQCEVHISDDFKFHYDELRYLFWDYYPLKLLPSDFNSKNLVWLCMPHSHLTQLWEGNKVFENLKYMDLRHSKYLTETPDFSSVTNLNSLILDGCTQLCKIHPSLGDLDKLTWLSLENCINLEHFPGISQLVSLETLILSGCSKLEKFLDISQHMPCLRQLYLDGTAITELPSSIDYATKLEILDLRNCRKLRSLPSSICKLTLLWCLSLSGCSDLGKCEVNSGNLDALPGTLDQLCSLKMLFLQNCWSLRALPALPSSLVILNASNCESLEDISPQSVFSLCRGSIFRNCSKLTKFQSRMERDLQSMAAKVDQEKWRSTFEEQNSEVDVQFSTVFPGSGIPDWFKHRSKRWRKIDMKVSPNWYTSNFLGFALCAVVAPKKKSLTSSWSAYCDLEFRALNSKWKSNRSFHIFDVFTRGLKDITIGSDHVWLAYVPSFLGFAPEKLIQTASPALSSRDEDCSYIDDGNPSGRDLDDFHESGEAERSSVQEDVNDSVLQDDAEPRGGDCNDGFKHLFDPQILTVSVVHGSQLICVT